MFPHDASRNPIPYEYYVAHPTPPSYETSQSSVQPRSALALNKITEITDKIASWQDFSPAFGLSDVDEAEIRSNNPHSVAAQKNAFAKKIVQNPEHNIQSIKRIFQNYRRMDLVDFIDSKLRINPNYFDNQGDFNPGCPPPQAQANFDNQYQLGLLRTENQSLREQLQELTVQLDSSTQQAKQLQTLNNELRASVKGMQNQISTLADQKADALLTDQKRKFQSQVESLQSKLASAEQRLQSMQTSSSATASGIKPSISTLQLHIPTGCNKLANSEGQCFFAAVGLTNIADMWEQLAYIFIPKGTQAVISKIKSECQLHKEDYMRLKALFLTVRGSHYREFTYQFIINAVSQLKESSRGLDIQDALHKLQELNNKQ
ncbi:hypothetical protein D5018_16950 [Parashewanella curva]|uniref:Death domain-containing protein n=1 Tax=Parashewanella curva TaxID=2338552 RepID=A0A3L8PTC0_9GAMM|nr:hypothetical protein [Parashewanella curva]RLV58504.1 hypothetical protein D5018_16950 [Parashewanella curva]